MTAEVEARDPHPEPTAGRRRRLLRAAVYGAALALLAWSAWVVPLPYTEYVPGSPTSIPPLVEVEGTETTEIDGDTALLTVVLRTATVRTAVGAWLDDGRVLRPTSEVMPDDVDREEFLEQERQRFQRQFDVAAAVGAEAAGVEVTIGMVPLIVDVVEGGPAEGQLRPGDVVRSVEGEPVSSAEQLQEAIRAHDVGETVTVAADRGGEPVEVALTLQPLEASVGDQEGSSPPPPGIGVLIETAADELELPFELQLAETRIGGPSAGLMIALTVYDLLSDEDLVDGRVIHGTGTVDAEGAVGPVGGVPEKMRAAGEADLVLVPDVLLQPAREAAPEGLDVAGVASFDEALEVLRETR